ncbi:MAG: hypothetical protein AAF846_22325 [Chloroflexota bacterium]
MSQVQIYRLTDEQRIDAKNEARKVVIAQYGDEPTLEQFQRPLPMLPNREDYQNRTVSDYPAWLTKAIGTFMVIVFIAAALPSLFRLFRVGYDYYYMGIQSNWQATVVGVSTFLLAEFLIVLSTVAMRVLFKSKLARAFFLIPIALGMAMAFVGNWTITQPHDTMAWLETIVPPIAVLFTAFIGEQMILHSIKTRYANERAYQQDRRALESERREQSNSEKLAYREALANWHDATKAPEQSDYWVSAYANAIRNKIMEANNSGTGKTKRMEYLDTLSRQEWIALVRQEIEAEQWFKEQHLNEPKQVSPVNPTPALPLESPVAVPVMSANGNSHYPPNGNGSHT